MGLAFFGLRAVRIHGVEDQHGPGFVILAQAGVIGEGAVRAEGVIAVIVADFGLAGGDDQALAGELGPQGFETVGHEAG